MSNSFKHFSLILIFLLQVPTSWANPGENAFKDQVYTSLRAKEFFKLEQLAETLRKEQSFFSTGAPKLKIFYEGLQKDSEEYTLKKRQAYIRLLQPNWRKN